MSEQTEISSETDRSVISDRNYPVWKIDLVLEKPNP